MESNNIKNDLEDDILAKILKDNITTNKAPNDFTKNTMNLVMEEWVKNPIVSNTKTHSLKYWIVFSISISIVGFIYIATDIRKMITMSNINWLKSFDREYLTILSSTYSSLIESFSLISPIVYIIIFGIISIMIIDIILKKSHFNSMFL